MPRSRSLVSRAPARVIYTQSTPGDVLGVDQIAMIDIGSAGGNFVTLNQGGDWFYADPLNSLPVWIDAVTPDNIRQSITLIPGQVVRRSFRVAEFTRQPFVPIYRAKVFYGRGECPFSPAIDPTRGGVSFDATANVVDQSAESLQFQLIFPSGVPGVSSAIRAGMTIDADSSAFQLCAAGNGCQLLARMYFFRTGYQSRFVRPDIVHARRDLIPAAAGGFATLHCGWRNVRVPAMNQFDPNAPDGLVDPELVLIQFQRDSFEFPPPPAVNLISPFGQTTATIR